MLQQGVRDRRGDGHISWLPSDRSPTSRASSLALAPTSDLMSREDHRGGRSRCWSFSGLATSRSRDDRAFDRRASLSIMQRPRSGFDTGWTQVYADRVERQARETCIFRRFGT
jgi:hypothetical protein